MSSCRLRAGAGCAYPSRFPWSRYRETAGAAPASGLLAPGLVLETLDDDVDAARARYVEIVDDALARLGRRRAEEAWWRAVERAAAATLETG